MDAWTIGAGGGGASAAQCRRSPIRAWIFELTADESERLAGEVVEVLRRYSSGPPRHGAVRVGITFRALPVLGGDA